MKFLEFVPGPMIVALVQGLLALVDTNIRQYFVDQPWLPVALTILTLLATLFNVYIKPKLAPAEVTPRALTASRERSTWSRILLN